MASEYGALDLASLSGTPNTPNTAANTQPTAVNPNQIPGPFIRTATDADFNEVVETSMRVPVIIDLWATWCEPCKQLSPVLEELATSYQGRFQLVTIDVEQAPQVQQAFQAQSVPTVIALIGGRPAPLFQGAQPKAQVQAVIEQVLQVAEQAGLTATMSGDGSAPAEPQLLPEQEEIVTLMNQGNLPKALEVAEHALRNQPQHSKIYQALVDEISFSLRLQGDTEDADPHAHADQLFAQGKPSEAYQVLLDLVANTDDEERESARTHLLELLRLGDNPELIKQVRAQLAQLLF